MRILKWLVVVVVVVGLLGGGYLYLESRSAAPLERAAPPALQPTAELTFAPAPVGQSEDGTAGLVPATARFTPAEEGAEVLLQRRGDDGWTDEATAEQDAAGVATFNVVVEPEKAAQFRVVLIDELEAAGSEAVRVRIKEPAFDDDFDGNALDPDKWAHRQVGLRNPDGKRACAESAKSSVSVADGYASLLVEEIPPDVAQASDEEQDCPHGEFYNGHIGTRRHFLFRYGVMAARIKFSHGQGQHGAFWSQPAAKEGGAEIDGVEYFGDGFPAKGELAGTSVLQHSIYWESEEGPKKVGGIFDFSDLLPEGETWADDFHVYSVEWTPTEYIFRVDGHETFRTSEGVSEVQQYLILSLLTSDWELPRFDASDPSPMEVDWVRVWRSPKGQLAPSEAASD